MSVSEASKDGSDLLAASERTDDNKPRRSSSTMVLHRWSLNRVLTRYRVGSGIAHSGHATAAAKLARSVISIPVPPVERRWEYRLYQDEKEVQDVIEEYEDLGELQYLVRFWNGLESEVRPMPF